MVIKIKGVTGKEVENLETYLKKKDYKLFFGN